jgi:hypothetical protein
MEIEIIINSKIKKKINVNFPYYYKHDLGNDSVIYGKITEDFVYNIQKTENFEGVITHELEKDVFDSSYHCYFSPEFDSSKEDYDKAKDRLLEFFNCF